MGVKSSTLALIAAASISTAVMATPTTFGDYAGMSGNTKNLQVTTSNSGATVITGFSNRTGTSATADALSQYATSGINLSEVGLIQFEFKSLAGLNVATGGMAGAGSMISTNVFFKNVTSPASPDNPTTVTAPYQVDNVGGTIVFKPTGSGTFANGATFNTDSILLAITFSDATLTRERSSKGVGQDTYSFGQQDYDPNVVSFYSDYLNFGSAAQQAQSQREFSITFQSDVDTAGSNNQQFRADSVGNFGSDPVPVVNPPAVPEASTWALMILGFGMIGGAMRNRRRSLVGVNA